MREKRTDYAAAPAKSIQCGTVTAATPLHALQSEGGSTLWSEQLRPSPLAFSTQCDPKHFTWAFRHLHRLQRSRSIFTTRSLLTNHWESALTAAWVAGAVWDAGAALASAFHLVLTLLSASLWV
jgi:hypothetical protein